jgi:hypothetical protein
MVSREEIRNVIIRVNDRIVDPDKLADAIAEEVLRLIESREQKEVRVVRAKETREG